jgi:hypothetical protein
MFKIKTLIKPETFSEISRDIAQIFFATLVVGQFFGKDSTLGIIVYGLLVSMAFWVVGLRFAKN